MNDNDVTPVDGQPEETAASGPDDKQQRRGRLNPTGGEAARPVPSRTKPVLDPQDTEQALEQLQAEAVDESPEPTEPDPEPVGPLAQQQAAVAVDLPPDATLDASLEAEIEAALASDDAALLEVAAHATADKHNDADPETDSPPIAEEEIEEGTPLNGTIVSVDQDSAFVDVGLRATGIVPRRQWEKEEPEPGQLIEVRVDRYDPDEGLIHLNLPRGRRRVGGDWDAVTPGMVCDCMVNKSNKGGLEVSVGSLRGFLPAGQVDRSYVENLDQYIGQKLTVQVVEVDSRRRNLVVSRRALLEDEFQDAAQAIWEQLEVGQTRSGTVKTIKDYGAFVDLGGLDGFLHIGEISWSRINHPSDVLTEGEAVDVKILSIDKERSRVGLGLRQLTHDPWAGAVEAFAVGRRVGGTVTRVMDFGAFVELEPGIEGLVHISELDHARVRRVGDVLNEGQEIEVQVLEVDPQRKRVSLSLKALKQKPDTDDGKDLSDEPPVERVDREELKGGTGTGSNMLFGDPGEFQ